jgi:hypothetical protein
MAVWDSLQVKKCKMLKKRDIHRLKLTHRRRKNEVKRLVTPAL